MNITVLPYIDSARTKPVSRTQASPSEDFAGDFSDSLLAAEKTIAAITVDLIVSQDEDRIQEAAAILNASSAPKLQALGQELLNSLDHSKSDTTADFAEASVNTAPVVSNPVSGNSASVSSDTAGISSTLGCPEELQPYFEEAAETYGVDIALLEAIAKAESNFSSDTVSSAGAIGIMQLMPSTASSLNVTNSYDAYQNIMGGAKLISSLLEKYGGDTSLALAAYNAGSGNVSKYGGIPPFTETQNYIAKVTGYYGLI